MMNAECRMQNAEQQIAALRLGLSRVNGPSSAGRRRGLPHRIVGGRSWRRARQTRELHPFPRNRCNFVFCRLREPGPGTLQLSIRHSPFCVPRSVVIIHRSALWIHPPLPPPPATPAPGSAPSSAGTLRCAGGLPKCPPRRVAQADRPLHAVPSLPLSLASGRCPPTAAALRDGFYRTARL